VGTAAFFAGLVRLDFANAQTILMLVPFAVTVVAARFGESVSLRRYALVALGFLGVLAVVRPTPADFSPWTLLVVGAAVTLVVREFATKQIAPDLPSLPIALLTAVAITSMMGLISIFTGWGEVTGQAVILLGLACVCLIGGYLFAIETVRVGDLSASAPFRYTAVVGAIVVGLLFFSESPDVLTLIGSALIIVAGVVSARDDVAGR